MHIRSCLLASAVFLISHLHADGFRNPPSGASAQGRIGGRIAYTRDASTVVHNPANMMELGGYELMGSLTFGYSRMEFTNAAGQTAESTSPWAVLPGFYAVQPPDEDGTWAFGVGLTSPYGRSTRLDEDNVFRFAAPYFTELRSLELSPSLARNVGDRVQVGFSLLLLYSELDLRQSYPWSFALGMPGLPDGKTRFEADGAGVGASAALTWNVSTTQRLAMSVRSPIKVEYEGDMRVDSIPPGVPAAPKSDFETEITFPMVVALAYGVRATERLTVEANVEWVRHSVFEDLKLDAGVNTMLLESDRIETDWSDNWTYGLSLGWTLNPEWELRAGYVYLESPVPSRTMLPTTAEQNQGVLSAGAGFQRDGHRLDLSYSLGLFSGRDISDSMNPVFNGTYDFEAHLISVNYGYMF